MKVLMITSRADVGGGPKYTLDLIKSLFESIEIYTATPTDRPFYEQYKALSKDVFEIPHRKFSILNFLGLIIFLWRHRIKVIHSHGRGAGIYSRLLGIFGFKVVHTFHGVHFSKNLKGRIAWFIEKSLLPLGSHYVFCSDDEKMEAFKWGIVPKYFDVILNAVDISKFNQVTIKNELKTIGTIARFDKVKGFDILFKNIEYLNSKNFNFNFLIAGATIEDFKNFNIPANVKVLGEISNVHEFYQSIDLLVSHSLKEGMPLTVLEAMASGVPCLLSNVPGHQYFIKNNMCIGFDLYNPNSFVSSLENLFSLKVRSKNVESALEVIKKNHTIHILNHKNISIYSRLYNNDYK